MSAVCWSPKDQESTAELQSAPEVKYIFFPEAYTDKKQSSSSKQDPSFHSKHLQEGLWHSAAG